LVDSFQSGERFHLVYEYEHLAISLGCAATNVRFSDADIATICKEVLQGLEYVHSELKTSYCSLDCSNILLTWQGQVKIGMSTDGDMNQSNFTVANVGECLVRKRSGDNIREDIKAIGSIVVSLSDRPTNIYDSDQDSSMAPLSEPARLFVQKAQTSHSVKEIMKVSFQLNK
jgi:serine/threonine protein kinase